MKKDKSKKSDYKAFLYWSIGIIAAWIIYMLLIPYIVPENKQGTFGDMFGALSSLFSGLAFAGIIYPIYLQKKELGLQREELEETRKELKRSADAQENSEKEFKNQARIMAIAAKINAKGNLNEYYQKRRERLKNNAGPILDEIDELIHTNAESLEEDLEKLNKLT